MEKILGASTKPSLTSHCTANINRMDIEISLAKQRYIKAKAKDNNNVTTGFWNRLKVLEAEKRGYVKCYNLALQFVEG